MIIGAFSLAFVSAMIGSLGIEWLEFVGLSLLLGLILALLFEADAENCRDSKNHKSNN
jgi:hypothetical protein